LENLKARDRSEDLVVDGKLIIELIVGNYCGKLRTGCMWLKKWISGGFLWTW